MRWNLPLVLVLLCAGPLAYGTLALLQPPKIAVFWVLFVVLFGLPLLWIAGRGLVALLRSLFS